MIFLFNAHQIGLSSPSWAVLCHVPLARYNVHISSFYMLFICCLFGIQFAEELVQQRLPVTGGDTCVVVGLGLGSLRLVPACSCSPRTQHYLVREEEPEVSECLLLCMFWDSGFN